MLSRNADIVQVAPYDSAFVGAGNGGTTAGQTRVDVITIGQKYRIRQNGTIVRVKVYIATLTNLTGVAVSIWRRTGAYPATTWRYSYVGISENFIASLSAGQINDITLASPITNVREGDYYCVTLLTTGACVALTTRTGQAGADYYYIVNTAPNQNNYDWLSKTKVAGGALPVEIYMQAPHAVFAGDSITAGYPAHGVYIDSLPFDGIEQTTANYFSALTNYECVYQNMGFPGNTTTQLAARFTADVVDKKPRYVVLMCGVNDIGGAVAKATFVANWTTMLDACIANGIIPVVMLIAPWTNGTTVQLQTRDDWNASLTALVGTYAGGVVVNLDPWVGQFRAGGDAGNLWDIQTDCDNDGVHFSGKGYLMIARALANALSIPVFTSISTSTPIRAQLLTALAARLATILIANGYRTDLGADVREWEVSGLDPNESTARIKYKDEEEGRVQEYVGEQEMVLDVTLHIETVQATPLAVMRSMIADVTDAIYTDVTFGGLAEDVRENGAVKIFKGQAADVAVGAEMKYHILYSVDRGAS